MKLHVCNLCVDTFNFIYFLLYFNRKNLEDRVVISYECSTCFMLDNNDELALEKSLFLKKTFSVLCVRSILTKRF